MISEGSIQDLKKSVKEFIKKNSTNTIVLDLTVASVNEEKYTCKTEGYGYTFEYTSLRTLNTPDDKGLIIIPKIGSQVTVLVRDEFNAYVIGYTEIDFIFVGDISNKVRIKYDLKNKKIDIINNEINIIIDDKVVISGGKVFLNTSTESVPITRGDKAQNHFDYSYSFEETIFQLITDICVALSTATVITPTGVGIFDPATIATMTQKIGQSSLQKGQVTTKKAQTSEIKSTKNFTE